MGAGIAYVTAEAGIPARLKDKDDARSGGAQAGRLSSSTRRQAQAPFLLESARSGWR